MTTNRVFDVVADRMIAGSFGSWSALDWRVSLHDGTATFDPSATDVASIGGQVGNRVELPVLVDERRLRQWDAVPVTGVSPGVTVQAVVVSAGSLPVVWFGLGGDHQPMRLVTTGEDVMVWGVEFGLTLPVTG